MNEYLLKMRMFLRGNPLHLMIFINCYEHGHFVVVVYSLERIQMEVTLFVTDEEALIHAE